MSLEERAFELLREAFPALEPGHFLIMKETRHPLWEQALEIAHEEIEDARNHSR